MPYRTQAQWNLLAVRRASTGWQWFLALGAVGAALGLAIAASTIGASPGTVDLRLVLALPLAAFVGFLAALAWIRGGRVEIFREGVRVHANGAQEARWEEITTLHRLVYRNLYDLAHDAGWALDTRDGRRLRIAVTYGDIEHELARHLTAHGTYVTQTDIEMLPKAGASDG